MIARVIAIKSPTMYTDVSKGLRVVLEIADAEIFEKRITVPENLLVLPGSHLRVGDEIEITAKRVRANNDT